MDTLETGQSSSQIGTVIPEFRVVSLNELWFSLEQNKNPINSKQLLAAAGAIGHGLQIEANIQGFDRTGFGNLA